MAQKTRWKIQDSLGRRRLKREKKREVKRRKTASRRKAMAKAVGVAMLLLVLLALALVVGDGDYRATAIGWVPLICVLVVLGLSYLYVCLLERSLVFSGSGSLVDCQRGKQIPFKVRLENTSPLVFFRLEVGFFISDLFGNIAHENVMTIALGPKEVYELEFKAQFDHIGTYEAGVNKIVIGDLLGVFNKTVEIPSHEEVDVTPQIQILERVNFDDAATVETTKAAKSILADSMDYSHVREYALGDPLKTIHWKLSARTDGYMTRLYEVYRDPGVAVIMNFGANSEDALVLMQMFDAVVESAFSIASFTREKGMDTEVHFAGRDGDPVQAFSWNSDEMPELVARMPQMSNDEECDKGALNILRRQVTSPHGQSTLVLCTASFSSELISALVDAKAQRRAPFMVAVVPSDLDGRGLDNYCKPLSRLDDANIPYVVISRSEELGVKLR